MIDSGLPVAMASDFNPGTSPSGNMQLILSMACIRYRLTPEEALNATTLNTAYAMGVSDEVGSITKGKLANLIVTQPMTQITSAINIVLDLALVDSMGVAGVALATIIAQGISAVLCAIKLLSLKEVFRLHRADFRPERAYIGRIIRLGVPSGLTQAIFSLAMMVVQRLINSFGDEMFVACNVMVMRVDGYAMLPNFSFGQAMSTFAGQNIGSRRFDRLKDGTRQGLMLSVGTALVLTPLVLLAGPALMHLFTPEQALIQLAMGMMYILAAGYVAMSVTQVLQGVMRGAGDTVTPMWISFGTTIAMRLPVAYGMVALMRRFGASTLTQERMVFVSLLAAWLTGMLVTLIVYRRGKWKKKSGIE